MLVLDKTKIILKTYIICLILICIFSVKSLAMVKPTSEFYINDYAKLLSIETKNYIMNANIKLQSQTGAQIVVVTVPNLEGSSLEDYATNLFRNFGIGDKNKNNGVLLLLALDEREFRVEVGYGLEGILPDGKTGRIQDEYIIPYLKQNNWDEGIKNGFSAILKEIEKEYNINVGSEDAIIVSSATSTSSYKKNSVDTLASIIMTTPIISSIVAIIVRNLKKIKMKNRIFISAGYMGLLTIFCFMVSIILGVKGVINQIICAFAIGIFNLLFFMAALLGKGGSGGYYGGRRIF